MVPLFPSDLTPALDLNFMSGVLPASVQFSRASTATYCDATGVIRTAATNVPRMDFDPTTLAAKGFLVEAAGTNLSYPSNQWWAAAAPTGAVDGCTQFSASAPNSTVTADLFIPGTFSSSTHQYYGTFGGAASSTYTHSIYAKASGYTGVQIDLNNNGFGANTVSPAFDLFNGTILTNPNGTATIASAGNGWYRISVSALSPVTGTSPWVAAVRVFDTGARAASNAAFTGNGTSGVLVWGNQVEAGYAPTSHIPTTTVAVTRAADVAYVSTAGLLGINGDTGSLFGQMVYEAPNPTLSYSRWLAFNDGTSVDAGTEWGLAAGTAYPTNVAPLVAKAGVALSVSVGTLYSTGAPIRFAQSFNLARMDAALNSYTSLNNTNAATNVPRTLTVLNLSQHQRYQEPASLWFQRVTYYPAYLGPNWVTAKASGAIP